MRTKVPFAVVLIAMFAGVVLGLSAVWSSEPLRLVLPTMAELQPIPTLEPVRALHRTEMVIAMEEARDYLNAERPWAAWTLLREHVNDPTSAPATTIFLAAKGAAGWGGWGQVEELLGGREWLDRMGEGEGWFLLGRAHEEHGEWKAAAAAFRRHASLTDGAARGISEARAGRALREAGRMQEASAVFSAAAEHLPAVADWMTTLSAEAAVAAGNLSRPSSYPLSVPHAHSSPAVRMRWARTEAMRREALGDPVRAVEVLKREHRVLSSQGAIAESADLGVATAALLHRAGRVAEARDMLRGIAWEATAPAPVRRRAATLLGEITDQRTASEELARASAYEAAGQPGLAARSLRAALAAGTPDNATTRLRLGKLLFDAANYAPARIALLDAASRLSDAERRAEARLLAARARYRSGDRRVGLAELRQVAAAYPSTAAAGTALFLLGDIDANLRDALSLYRQAAEIERSPNARAALYRVGDRSLKIGQTAAALRAWEEYVARYPRGEQTATTAFHAGQLHEQAGRTAKARALYSAAMLADPLSYYAVRAGERLALQPLDRVLSQPHPWVGLAADPVQAAAALDRLDLLQQAALDEAWEEELQATLRRFDGRPVALLALAEGLRDRGHTREAIRLGRRLLQEQEGEWNLRLLRVVFPLPYRTVLMHEAERSDVDPMLLAGLARQESLFEASARSRVGAAGLTQIMPSTGRWLAPSVGIGAFQERMLLIPEVNLRMGAYYLADLLDRYDGARDLALAGYNAGPGRADRWRKTLGHDRDIDAFRENIPFDETRHYVKVVLRNAAIYDRLYTTSRP